MPIKIAISASTLLIRRHAFERAGLTRSDFDAALNLTDEEFRVEGGLIAIGPVFDSGGLATLVSAMEDRGLLYFDDFFELSGNWPEWLGLFAMGQEVPAG
jgi:hypothetical protein